MSILSEKKFRLLALTYLLMFAAAPVFAVQCSDMYSNGIQNNDSGGKIEIEDYISINGGDQNLVTNSLSGGSYGCAGQNCIAAGGPFFSSSPSFQTSTNVDGNINVSKNSSLLVGNSGDYRFGEVNVGQGANLTFSASQSVYYFSGGWEIGKNAPLTLAPGDYWINGDVKIEQGVGLHINPAGSVRIFASGDVEIVKNAAINSGGSAGQLLIYSEKSIKIDQGVGLKGYLYSNDEIKIEKNAAITGGISSKGTLGIKKGVSINYVSPSGDFGNFCDATVGGPDHYHISHAGTGITCEQSVITITPHDASHAAVSADGTTITLSSTPGSDGWTQITAAGTLTGNQYTFASNTSVQLGLSKLTPASLDIDITDGSATDVDGDTSGEDPPIIFSDVGFKFYSNATVDSIGTQISGKDSNVAPDNQTLTIKAVKTSEVTGRCDALINGGVVNIGMGFECNNPSSCVLGTGLSIAGANPAAPVPGVSNGASLSYQSVGLNFNASGEASFVLNYLDAGQITLHASADLPVGNTVKTVTGSSNAFVVKPAGFCLESDAGLGACGATGAACAPFKKAGENFNLVVSAKRWGGASDTNYCDNATTQNFAGPVTVGSTLDSTLVGSAAGLGVTTAIISAGTSGGRAVVSQTVDNVGNFVFFGSTANYLNTGPIANSSGELIGRFVPYQFEIKDRPIALANFGYAYVGQPFTVKFDIEAQNIDGDVVTNYNGDLADLVSGDLSYGIRNNATSPLSSLNSRVVVIPSTLIWSDGQSSHDQLLTVSRNGLEAPFFDLQVGVVVDAGYNEGGITIGAITLDLDTTLDAADDRVLIAEMSLKVGRLFSQDVWGPENTSLDVPLRVEYWDGSQWLAAAGDGTALDRSEIVFTSSGGSAAAITSDPITAPIGSNPSVIFAQDPTGASVLTFGDGLSSAATGDSLMQVGAPGSTGFFTMDIDLSNYPWLRFDWNQDGDHDNDTALPTVNIRFETYRGHDRVIYWQEVGL